MKILVTGAAGFIGFFTCEALLQRGFSVTGIDNLNAYYDPALKEGRLAILQQHKEFQFIRAGLEDRVAIDSLFSRLKPRKVIHLAAQAGVRASITNPHAYVDSNITGFLHILEGCRHAGVEHLVFASSSSVYGANTKLPFSEHDAVDHPTSLYGATKKANEMMAHAYAHLYGVPITGLRFFTVYGPWGRPDMAPFIFTKKIIEDQPIDVYNHGQHERDFTYIADIVDGVLRTIDKPPQPRAGMEQIGDPATAAAPFRIYNIGNNTPVQLLDFIACIENAVGKTAIKNFLPMQPGDVLSTYADIDDLAQATGYKPSTPIEVGIPHLVEWYRSYYRS